MRTQLLAPLAAVLLLLGACSEAEPVSSNGPTRGADRDSEAPTEPSESPTESATEDNGSGGGERTVAVYYIGDTDRAGPRLYREFQRQPGDPFEAALTALTSQPLDPDYRTAWTANQLLAFHFDGVGSDGIIGVTVDPSVRQQPAGMSRAEAEAAVEQVIYTAQAAVQARAPVQFFTSDNPIDQVFGVPTSEPLTNGQMLDVLSHVSLTTPEQGSAVDDGTLEISGVGNSFEANVGWEIRQGNEVVMDGFATMAGWMEPKLFPFETTADISDLPPGDYTLWVTTDDPTGGTEGIGAMTDDKDFTVE